MSEMGLLRAIIRRGEVKMAVKKCVECKEKTALYWGKNLCEDCYKKFLEGGQNGSSCKNQMEQGK